MSLNSRITPSTTTQAQPVRGPLTRYVDFAINNPTGDQNKVAEFQHTYNGDVLPRASDYLVAPISFKIPVQDLPLYIFPVEPNQTVPAGNSNVSTIQVGICKNKTAASIAAGTITDVAANLTALVWEPQEMGVPAPLQSEPLQVVTPYYYGYSFEHFVNLVNTAIDDAYVASGSPGNVLAEYPPVFSYDETNNIFKWELDTNFTGNTQNGATDGYTVCWNKAFDNLLNNFNVIENGSDQFILEDTKSALTHTVGNVITLAQDHPTTEYFNGVERILALTNSIPITQDFFPSGDGVPQGLSAKQSVLADVIPDYDNNLGKLRSPIVYNPPNLEWSDMSSPLPLRSISVRFVWIDSTNRAHNIEVAEGQNIPVRLAFRHKSLIGL